VGQHTPGSESEPVDPDLPSVQGEPPGHPLVEPVILFAVAVGGVVGSLARYEAGSIWPTAPGTFPWTTFWINVVGSALIGAVVVLAADVFHSRLARPFFGTGILGGFTTFSAYAVDSERLFRSGHQAAAWANLALSLLGALTAVTAATWLTRRVVL